MIKICDVIIENCRKYSSKNLFTYFEGDNIIESINYKQFLDKVFNFAGYLQKMECEGERLLILLPTSIDYMVVFCASLLTHSVAIPLYEVVEKEQAKDITNIIKSCDINYIVSNNFYKNRLEGCLGESLEDVVLCNINDFEDCQFHYKDIVEGEIAYLQYTSGSTSAAKGVKISYSNILAMLDDMKKHYKFNEKDVFISWLPFHFDMGLVGNMMNALYSGGQCCFTSAAEFMKQPVSWLKAISAFKGTVITAPNFAYELCTNLSDEIIEGIDLSSLKLVVNGAENVKNRTIKAFVDKYIKYGLNKNTINPSYGLAENTLVVTSHEPRCGYKYLMLDENKLRNNIIEFVEDGLEIVSVGQKFGDLDIRIIDIEKKVEVEEKRVGEIWITSKALSDGYWNISKEDDDNFNSRLEGEEKLFFKTGDLGFMHNKFLYIVGRKKDMIIIRGKNIYSNDIEELIINGDEEFINTAIAFGITLQTEEKLVVIVEVTDETLINDSRLKEHIRNKIITNCKISVWEVILKKKGSLPRTDSGKVQKQLCKKEYLKSC